MNNPSVSVLLPVYNGESDLQATIAGIQKQSKTDYELLVLDDGSTDNTWDVILKLAKEDTRIKPLRHQQNKGIVAALNRMASEAKGEILIREDCGDLSATSRYQTQYLALQSNPKAVICLSSYWLLEEDGTPLALQQIPTTPSVIEQQLRKSNIFSHSTFAMRKSSFHQAGGYDPKARHVEDYDLLIRLSRLGEIIGIPEPLVAGRLSPNGITFRNFKNQNAHVQKLHSIYYDAPVPENLDWLPLTADEARREYHLHVARIHLAKGRTQLARKHLSSIPIAAQRGKIRLLSIAAYTPGFAVRVLRKLLGKKPEPVPFFTRST